MEQKPTYRIAIRSKRTGKKIQHIVNNEDYGYYCSPISHLKLTDERMRDIALGIIYGLMPYKQVYVEVLKLNEKGGYNIIYTQF